ncbi:MAG: hypothetical protein ACFFBJ_07115, partial [Promethearchaeota archaeon]
IGDPTDITERSRGDLHPGPAGSPPDAERCLPGSPGTLGRTLRAGILPFADGRHEAHLGNLLQTGIGECPD